MSGKRTLVPAILGVLGIAIIVWGCISECEECSQGDVLLMVGVGAFVMILVIAAALWTRSRPRDD